jgi:hypothetical protein
VTGGMLRLYEGEVLNKLPVVQHVVFGPLLRCTWIPTKPQLLPTPPSHSGPAQPLSSFPLSLPGAPSGVRHHGKSAAPTVCLS